MGAERQALSDRVTREGFGPDACDQDRVDAPTRDRLQRLYGSVDLLADRSRATADGQYEDVKALEVIIGDLRAEKERYRTVIKTALDTMGVANDAQLGPGGIARKAYAGLWHAYFAIPAGIESPPASDEEDSSGSN